MIFPDHKGFRPRTYISQEDYLPEPIGLDRLASRARTKPSEVAPDWVGVATDRSGVSAGYGSPMADATLMPAERGLVWMLATRG